ncbi:MAG TPA: type III pantothenate kinase [Phycisphaerae bacterium]|jgi:type III pantothenate kinase|nr:type III pantothenate kinase [Phycisphaerae bacterium]
MPVLAIDIGNTRIGLNAFSDGKAADPALRLTHAELDKELAPTLKSLWQKVEAESDTADDEDTGIIIASVVPALTARLEAAVQKELTQKPILIGRDLKVPIKTMLTDESTVGTDRLLAAVASFVNTEAACAIIHAGTALVVDCIDAEGIFRGGAIAPGLRMSGIALHEYAAQLPEASLTPPADDVPFGRFTQEAINLGLFAAARGTARELLERYATALGAWPHVVATGGDAQLLFADIGLVDSFIPDLALQGAALVWEHARKR